MLRPRKYTTADGGYVKSTGPLGREADRREKWLAEYEAEMNAKIIITTYVGWWYEGTGLFFKIDCY